MMIATSLPWSFNLKLNFFEIKEIVNANTMKIVISYFIYGCSQYSNNVSCEEMKLLGAIKFSLAV